MFSLLFALTFPVTPKSCYWKLSAICKSGECDRRRRPLYHQLALPSLVEVGVRLGREDRFICPRRARTAHKECAPGSAGHRCLASGDRRSPAPRLWRARLILSQIFQFFFDGGSRIAHRAQIRSQGTECDAPLQRNWERMAPTMGAPLCGIPFVLALS